MDCSYCKKDMADSDICPSCGMGKRVDFELFKTDKAERKKSFEDYEKEYLNRLENGDKPNNEKDKSESENKPNPDNWNTPTIPNSGSNKGLMIALGLGIPLLLGIVTGAMMAMSGGGDVTYVYEPMQPTYMKSSYPP
ncbi:hypothetical protein OAP30_04160 [Nitrosopumilus sp.]|nr:hypothetical protein [Nitrosopumilus sp.]